MRNPYRTSGRARVIAQVLVAVSTVAVAIAAGASPSSADSSASIDGSHVSFMAPPRGFFVNDPVCDGYRAYAKFFWQRPGENRSPTRTVGYSERSDRNLCGPPFVLHTSNVAHVPEEGALFVHYRACIAKPGKDPCSKKVLEFVPAE